MNLTNAAKEFAIAKHGNQIFKELPYNPQDIELLPVWNRLENSNK